MNSYSILYPQHSPLNKGPIYCPLVADILPNLTSKADFLINFRVMILFNYILGPKWTKTMLIYSPTPTQGKSGIRVFYVSAPCSSSLILFKWSISEVSKIKHFSIKLLHISQQDCSSPISVTLTLSNWPLLIWIITKRWF